MDSAVVAPSGAITLCAAAVDAMLKAKDYREGTLYDRIEQAAGDHLITEGMAKWAHEVRLDANAERHADEDYQHPTPKHAQRCIAFVVALGEIVFVLPERVNEGRKQATGDVEPATPGDADPTSTIPWPSVTWYSQPHAKQGRLSREMSREVLTERETSRLLQGTTHSLSPERPTAS